MDRAQLQAFDRIVREGGFSRAARALGISQPAITARMQQLEREVGHPLFIRGGRGPTLTHFGESLLPYVQRALAILDEGVEAARASERGEHGRITIGVTESLAGGFLASAIARFTTTHPRIEFFVHTGHSDQIVEMMDDGLARLGLVTWPLLDDRVIPLVRFREPLILVASPAHPLTKERDITVGQAVAAADPLLLVRWGPAFNELIAGVGDSVGRMLELPIQTIRELLLRGIGAAFLPRGAVARELRDGLIAEIPLAPRDELMRECALITLRQTVQLPAAMAFLAVVEDEAAAHHVWHESPYLSASLHSR